MYYSDVDYLIIFDQHTAISRNIQSSIFKNIFIDIAQNIGTNWIPKRCWSFAILAFRFLFSRHLDENL